MTNNKYYSSSKNTGWITPWNIFLPLDDIFKFDLDACASASNTKCEVYFTEDDNCLNQDWIFHKNVWMNPPYQKSIKGFPETNLDNYIIKAFEQVQNENIETCVILVNNCTEKKVYHRFTPDLVFFPESRISFLHPDTLKPSGSPTKGNMILFYTNKNFDKFWEKVSKLELYGTFYKPLKRIID